MKVLITGGAGFIGRNLTNFLNELGWQITVIDKKENPFSNQINYYKGDILDKELLDKVLTGIDLVIHLAAIANVNEIERNIIDAERINSGGTLSLLHSMKENHVFKIIFTSSIWVYQNSIGNEVDEATPLYHPDHLYTSTKLTGEFYCVNLAKLFNINYIIFRLGVPYGPWARPGTAIYNFINNALNKQNLCVMGNGSQTRNFIYIEDICNAFEKAIRNQNIKNEIFNIEGSEPISIFQLAKLIQKRFSYSQIMNVNSRNNDFEGKTISIQKAKTMLNWEPLISFETGLTKYIDWWIKNV